MCERRGEPCVRPLTGKWLNDEQQEKSKDERAIGEYKICEWSTGEHKVRPYGRQKSIVPFKHNGRIMGEHKVRPYIQNQLYVYT